MVFGISGPFLSDSFTGGQARRNIGTAAKTRTANPILAQVVNAPAQTCT